ncbi:P-loop containing nucleoside triphosphate hydrolase protein [Pleomassaria siparia CBS 279.74]|uniref:ATP-dependent DNA helicase n=1 Tax=Pleomassaria siparia CBS 279.74 TaxID=1314801 RepID=A0A6G1K4Z9_9PLEO|nr:P-loop containing nucleoside triphosphate hydrolase protein [Pleomassaria siparia CBS 279.74]
MTDSDEYGDLDDTAFIEVASQYERHATPAFHSPRPLKRRKLAQNDIRIASIPSIPSKPLQKERQRGPFLESDTSDDAFDPDPAPRRSKNRASTETDDRISSTDGTSSSSTKRRKPACFEEEKNKEENDSPRKRPAVRTKKDRIYVPKNNAGMQDNYLTQPPPENSPPWKTRGAIWQKPTLNIGVHRPSEAQSSKLTGLDAMKTMALAARQSISSRPVSRSAPRGSFASEYSNSPIEIDELPTSTTANDRSMVYNPSDELADLPSDAFTSSSSSPQKQGGDVVLMSSRRVRVAASQTGLRQTTLFGGQGVVAEVPPSQVNKRYNFIADQKEEPPTHHKLDPEAIKTWVYPANLGKTRDYQYNIVHRGLFHNLLVALPTGLGKTFIAATIMLNWFRWTTEAQIVFVAPTKPLVSQQVEACFKIAGIPRSATTMLTGNVLTGLRAEEWKEKRVFFMTPQTLMNDLKSGIADPKKIVLVVVDEAHRATGSYSYVEMISFMRRFNSSFRVLALTATPGDKVESVQAVIDGLDISKIEIRTENSLDIKQYVHHRVVEKKVFQNSDEMELCMELYSNALGPAVSKLAGLNAFWSKDPLDLTPYGCTQAMTKWMKEAGRNASAPVRGMVRGIFAVLASISQGMELLKYHGIRPFYTKMKEFKDSLAQSKSKNKKEICDHESFKKLLGTLSTWVAKDEFIGHPKLEHLQEVILNHFASAGEGENPEGAPPSQTRVMIFAHFRDSAEDIVRVLNKQQPMIRPHVFVGQASAKNSEGMGQKDQLQVIEKFKSGIYNTLVATSIGEEGLDIGEVDLIVCYDSKASPIRMLQRMGRTGRKRAGKIIMLQMEGKEVKALESATDNYEKMQEMIADGSRFTFHDDISRRILPKNVQPLVDKRVVEIPIENSQADWLPEPRKGGRAPKRPPKKFHMPDGAITGFVSAGRMDQEIAPKSRAKKKVKQILPSEELVVVPPLESVLLNDEEMEELESRFQHLPSDDEDDDDDDDKGPLVEPLNLGGHTARQRTMALAHHLPGPGRVRRGFVETLRRMHAMDDDRLDEFRSTLRYSDCDDLEPESNIVVPDKALDAEPPMASIEDEMWADDDPPSPVLLALNVKSARAKPGPKPKVKAAGKSKTPPVGIDVQTKAIKKSKTSPAVPVSPTIPTVSMEIAAKVKPGPKPRAKMTPKALAPRGRPRNDPSAPTTSAPQPTAKAKATPNPPKTPKTLKTPIYPISNMAEEGEASSPPPTDPRMQFLSQADTIGSDDTLGGLNEVQDTQAYRFDSDLVSFIAEDDEEVGLAVSSSLPLLGFGLGKGTQAVVNSGKKRPKKAVKLFSSDESDDDAIVSSDSDSDSDDDDDVSVVRKGMGAEASKPMPFSVDSATEDEDEDDEPIVRPRKRPRRVVLDDEDDDDDDE